jgi:hypothetical protein
MEPLLVLKIIVPVAYSAFEYWLGKTNKVKANSALELVVHTIQFAHGKWVKK